MVRSRIGKRLIREGLSLLGLTVVGCSFFCFSAFATDGGLDDLSPEEIAAKLSASNASQEEIEALLRARGVSDDEIEAYLNGTATDGDELADPSEMDTSISDDADERVELAPMDMSDLEELAAEGQKLPFGYELFETSPESYRQPAFGPVDSDYTLGPGDEVVLDVWGDTLFRTEHELDREGGVNLPDVGRVVLAGKTLGQAENALRRRLARVYSGLGKTEDDPRATTHMSVTLGNLRVIRVFVVGRARRPGGYDLSAASTVFHALFFAGGPTLEGSLRDIRVLRHGRVIANLDVYDYLRTGKRDGDIRLENDDTVFIPATGPRIEIQGEVREPGIYEVRDSDTVAAILETSGGFTERAFRGRVQIERILTPEEQAESKEDRAIHDVTLDEEGSLLGLRDGDLVSVFEVAEKISNFVQVQGQVRRPGKYQFDEGMKLTHALQLAGGVTDEAFLDRAQIVRNYDDGRREQMSVDLRKVVAGEIGYDLRLSPRDELTVHSIWDLQDGKEVSIYGAVRQPGTYELRDRMTLRDLLLQAGGVHEHAYLDEIEVSRLLLEASEDEIQTTEIFRVALGDDYLSTNGEDFRLRAYDNIFVREQPHYELQRNVHVRGAVRFPGMYSLTNPQETVAEVIARAGGLKEAAYPQGFQLVREKDEVGRVALNLEKAIKNPRSSDNVILVHGDSLYVPEEPKTVTVKGEVGFPTSLVFEPGRDIGDYISRAGGLTPKADKGQIRVMYSTGAAARVKRFWFDPDVKPGSTIFVPMKDEDDDVNWGNVIRDTTSILASLATVVLLADQVGK